MVELAHVTGNRQNDLKDERRRAQMAAARQVLERSTMMLLTSTKVLILFFIYSHEHLIVINGFSDLHATSRLRLFKRESRYSFLPNETCNGSYSLRCERWYFRYCIRS